VESVRTGIEPVCGIAAASAHTLCVNRLHDGGFPIRNFPTSCIEMDLSEEVPRRFVPGLKEALCLCYERNVMLSEVWGDVLATACLSS